MAEIVHWPWCQLEYHFLSQRNTILYSFVSRTSVLLFSLCPCWSHVLSFLSEESFWPSSWTFTHPDSSFQIWIVSALFDLDPCFNPSKPKYSTSFMQIFSVKAYLLQNLKNFRTLKTSNPNPKLNLPSVSITLIPTYQDKLCFNLIFHCWPSNNILPCIPSLCLPFFSLTLFQHTHTPYTQWHTPVPWCF